MTNSSNLNLKLKYVDDDDNNDVDDDDVDDDDVDADDDDDNVDDDDDIDDDDDVDDNDDLNDDDDDDIDDVDDNNDNITDTYGVKQNHARPKQGVFVVSLGMIIVHAYTMITVHISYTVGLVFLAVEAGGLGEEAPQVSRGYSGPTNPPNSDHINNLHFTLPNRDYFRIN